MNLDLILTLSITIALDVDEFKFRFKLLLIEHIFNENIKELQPLSIILKKRFWFKKNFVDKLALQEWERDWRGREGLIS